MNRFQVYFDGLCVVCAKEISFYRNRKGAEAIEWVDISAPGFQAEALGKSDEELMKVFHVRDEKGTWITGVEGFIEIWKRIPSLQFLAQFARVPGVRPVLKLGYRGFVRVRPYLPRSEPCLNGHCDVKLGQAK
jgi:predicted DCC family thiol-disulfide oxidoreductase YuxK